MNAEAQNIAIAKACNRKYHKPTEEELASGSYYQYEPDFTRDLNLCASMEKHIVQAGSCYTHYVSELQRLTEHNEWRATAAQRCEAFLRCIGKWEDEKPCEKP